MYYLYALIVVIPSFALTFRRLHDINKSAWWILISWIPLIGQIWFFILMVTEGTLGGNTFGSDPKAA
ncbi:DUF805 domain-containing protein [Fusibacter sp. A1]|uniref:DUF805 domain-containing protein n=1 Tax=Fusibacter sp. A1 TaxID=2283630 RepID=UPI001013966A|nr:DUF805 domain-containing protein [Fusibacter sp. A1]RXV61594.1 DUF805 domain-containing protein [Fusibacter sp. A1]